MAEEEGGDTPGPEPGLTEAVVEEARAAAEPEQAAAALAGALGLAQYRAAPREVATVEFLVDGTGWVTLPSSMPPGPAGGCGARCRGGWGRWCRWCRWWSSGPAVAPSSTHANCTAPGPRPEAREGDGPPPAVSSPGTPGRCMAPASLRRAPTAPPAPRGGVPRAVRTSRLDARVARRCGPQRRGLLPGGHLGPGQHRGVARSYRLRSRGSAGEGLTRPRCARVRAGSA